MRRCRLSICDAYVDQGSFWRIPNGNHYLTLYLVRDLYPAVWKHDILHGSDGDDRRATGVLVRTGLVEVFNQCFGCESFTSSVVVAKFKVYACR